MSIASGSGRSRPARPALARTSLLLAALVVAAYSKPKIPLPRALRCAACKRVAWSVENQYTKEAGRSKDETFKVGHRMQNNQKWQNDDKRKRKYVGSEVFADEVLSSVCPGVVDRASAALEEYTGKAAPKGSQPTRLASVLGSSLEDFCHTLVEEHEEGLKERIQSGEAFTPKLLNKRLKRWLCYRAANECTAAQVEGSSGEGGNVPPEVSAFMSTADGLARQTEDVADQLKQNIQQQTAKKWSQGSIYEKLSVVYQNEGIGGILSKVPRWIWVVGVLIGILVLVRDSYLSQPAAKKDYSAEIKAARDRQQAVLTAATDAAKARPKQE